MCFKHTHDDFIVDTILILDTSIVKDNTFETNTMIPDDEIHSSDFDAVFNVMPDYE